jgi:hypothetical protein
MHFFRVFLLLVALPLLAAGDPGSVNTLSADEQAAGWRLLFDGKAVTGLRGWQKPDFLRAGWKIEDGALYLPKPIEQMGRSTGGDLITTEAFVDFEFSFEWLMSVSGHSGVLYFARAMLGQPPTGCEFQLIDDMHHPDGLKGGPIRRTGALYGILPPGENKQIDPMGWNSGRIVVQGTHVEHWVNGQKVLEYEAGSPALMQAVRASKMRVSPSFGQKVKSVVVLLDQGDEVSFRNLKIRPLPPVGGRN